MGSCVQISNVINRHFGNCVEIKNNAVQLLVTVDFGPRIIHFSCTGMDNMFYEDHEWSEVGESFEEFGGNRCRLYGGHRLWTAPEEMPRTYYPDQLPVAVKQVAGIGTVEFQSQPERFNNVQKIVTITMSENEPIVTIRHEVINLGMWDIELAAWGITMLDAGAKQIIPLPSRKERLLPNGLIALWAYSAMDDSRVHWGKDYILIQHDHNKDYAFKTGLHCNDGWVAAFNKEQLFIKRFEKEYYPGNPDYGCNYETYVDGKAMEVESIGRLTKLKRGESTIMTEEWELRPQPWKVGGDADEIADFMLGCIRKK